MANAKYEAVIETLLGKGINKIHILAARKNKKIKCSMVIEPELKTFSIQGNDVCINGIYQIHKNVFSGDSEDFPQYYNINPRKIKCNGELTPSGGKLKILIEGEIWGEIEIKYIGPKLDKPISL